MGRKRECEKDDKESLHLLSFSNGLTQPYMQRPCHTSHCATCAAHASGTPPTRGSVYATTIRKSLCDIKNKKNEHSGRPL
jgi:hypothetical protein